MQHTAKPSWHTRERAAPGDTPIGTHAGARSGSTRARAAVGPAARPRNAHEEQDSRQTPGLLSISLGGGEVYFGSASGLSS